MTTTAQDGLHKEVLEANLAIPQAGLSNTPSSAKPSLLSP